MRKHRRVRAKIAHVCKLLVLTAAIVGAGIMLNKEGVKQIEAEKILPVFKLVDTVGIHHFPAILEAEGLKGKVKEETKEESKEEPEKTEEIEEIKDEIAEERMLIAFTFDDGPHASVTEEILDILEENGAKGTFFILGDRVKQHGNIVQQIYDRGHQVANHTLSHKDLTKLSKEELLYEVSKSRENLQQYAPQKQFYLRPPYGAINDTVKAELSVPVIGWSVDSLDWKSRNSESIYHEVMSNVKDGDIILMHDLYTTTADALRLVVPELIKQGYELVTVEELLSVRKEAVEAGKVYHHAR